MESRSFEVVSVEDVFFFTIFGIRDIIPHVIYLGGQLHLLLYFRNLRETPVPFLGSDQ